MRNVARSLIPLIHRSEDLLAALLLIVISILPAAEIVARTAFRTGVPGSTEYIQHLVIWLTFVGGIITSRQDRHLALATVDRLSGFARAAVGTVTGFTTVAVLTALASASWGFVTVGFDASTRVGALPVRWVTMVMPVGFAVMALRAALHAPGGWAPKLLSLAGLAFPLVITALPAAVESGLLWPLVGVLVVETFIGVPLFAVLGGIACLLFFTSGGEIASVPAEAYTMLTGPVLPTIPLFTFAGFVLARSKAGHRLARLFQALFGWLPGGMALMAALVCAFFTTFTGASGVTVIALGMLLYVMLTKGGYDPKFSHGLLTAAGSLGLLFPPSLPVILYGVMAHTNIAHVFAGGVAPGVVTIMAVAALGVANAVRNKIPPVPFRAGEAVAALKDAAWEAALPAIVVVGFFRGYLTLVETGAVTVIYALIVEMLIKRDIKPRDFIEVVRACMPVIGGVLVILAAAKGLSYFIVDAEIPTLLTAWAREHVHSRWVFLLLLNAALLVVGCLMDMYSAILVVVPLIVPLGQAFGVDPVHLGIIFLVNLEVGYLTPPVGINLFLASYTFNVPLVQVYRRVLPFLAALLVALVLITYVPAVTTLLPGLMK